MKQRHTYGILKELDQADDIKMDLKETGYEIMDSVQMTFRIGSSGVPLCARKCNFGFHKEQGMF
jgi:hypothetical protein